MAEMSEMSEMVGLMKDIGYNVEAQGARNVDAVTGRLTQIMKDWDTAAKKPETIDFLHRLTKVFDDGRANTSFIDMMASLRSTLVSGRTLQSPLLHPVNALEVQTSRALNAAGRVAEIEPDVARRSEDRRKGRARRCWIDLG